MVDLRSEQLQLLVVSGPSRPRAPRTHQLMVQESLQSEEAADQVRERLQQAVAMGPGQSPVPEAHVIAAPVADQTEWKLKFEQIMKGSASLEAVCDL